MIAKRPISLSSMPKKQSGVVLIVGLLILLVMTVVGITAMRSTTLDEHISANTQFKTIAFQAAESALSEASTFQNIVACSADPMCRPGAGGVIALDPRGEAILNKAYSPAPRPDDANNHVHAATATATIYDSGEIPMPGSSIGEGGGAIAVLRVFDIDAKSELAGANANADHNQRIGRVAPAGN